MSAAPAPPPVDRGSLRLDVRRALRDAAKLGTSLLGTWAIGIAVRIYVPRHLGPAGFGELQFAEAFTATVFVVAGLGLETYVRKEVVTRREHATDFFGGTLVLRLVLSAVILAAAMVGLRAAGRTPDVLGLVCVLGLAQVVAYTTGTYAAMLHAVGEVDGVAAWNVVSKLLWGLGIGVAVVAGWGVMGLAAAVLASEAVKVAALAVLARRHVGLRFRVDAGASLAAVRASLPFFLGGVAQTVYNRVDVSILAFLTSTTEVGWYGAGGALAGVSLLLSPLIGWVLLPLSSRAAARSADELMLVARRSMETILCIAAPASLFLFLAARELVALAYGPAFAPAALSLRILAPTLLLTYVAMVSASVLIRLERGWATVWVTVAGMLIAPVLNLWFVPVGQRFGPGGAGAASGVALVLTELYAAAAMAWLVGRGGVDRRLTGVALRTAAVCAGVVAADRLLAPLGAWRLAADAGLYVAAACLTGAVRPAEVAALVRDALASRRAARRAAG